MLLFVYTLNTMIVLWRMQFWSLRMSTQSSQPKELGIASQVWVSCLNWCGRCPTGSKVSDTLSYFSLIQLFGNSIDSVRGVMVDVSDDDASEEITLNKGREEAEESRRNEKENSKVVVLSACILKRRSNGLHNRLFWSQASEPGKAHSN